MANPFDMNRRSAGLAALVVVAAMTPAGAARGATLLLSRSEFGGPADAPVGVPGSNADGSAVSFVTRATDLGGPTDETSHLYLREHTDAFGNGTITYLDVFPSAEGYSDTEPEYAIPASISQDARYVAFAAYTSRDLGDEQGFYAQDIYVHDRDTDGDAIFDEPGAITTHLVTDPHPALEAEIDPATGRRVANNISDDPQISRDGRWVTFSSWASNLLPGDTNDEQDVYAANVQTGALVKISRSTIGQAGNGPSIEPTISSDGRRIAFSSLATNLANLPSGDVNGASDVFLVDRDSDADGLFDELGAIDTSIVSVGPGRSQGNGPSLDPFLSADGARVVFTSLADNLAAPIGIGPAVPAPPIDRNGLSDIYIRDVVGSATSLASVNLTGTAGDGASLAGQISDDGASVSFASLARDMTQEEATGQPSTFQQAYIRDLLAQHTSLVSVNSVGQPANADVIGPVLAVAHQTSIVYLSEATNLEPGAFFTQVYRFQRDVCGAGEREDGVLSSLVHDTLESLFTEFGPTLHDLNCDVVVPNEP